MYVGFKIEEETPLWEAGVTYCRNRYPSLEPLPPGYYLFRYRWEAPKKSLWDRKKTGESTVYVGSRCGFLTLLAHWNRSDWKYTEVL